MNTCGLDREGTALCWGTAEGPTPKVVATGHAFTTLSRGYDHLCALDASGQAWCWGAGSSGQLGGGTFVVATSQPAPVAGGGSYSDIVASRMFTCALSEAGMVWCWGDNGSGQLGVGTNELSTSPVRVLLPPGRYTSVTAGRNHACAVEEGGVAYCWGSKADGQLGIPSMAFSAEPVAVAAFD
jgi:alpha-tubulin suppressor-like RCC1 family protein